jgi:hypothetical protein
MRQRRGISILIEAVVVTIMIIGAFSVAYYYTVPSNTRVQRSQTDISQTAYNILSSLARAHEFDHTIINGEAFVNYYSNCVHNTPNISVTPGSIWSKPGGKATYVITVVNNDQFCGNELFLVSVSLPSSAWNYSLDNAMLTLPSNGGSSSTHLSVISPSTLGNSGSFNIIISVSNIAIGIPQKISTSSAIALYVVNNALPCIYQQPNIAVSPNSQTSPQNTNVSYAIVVTNNDQNCGMETFYVSALPLSNWTASLSQSVLSIASGFSASTTLYETLNGNNNIGKGVVVTTVNAANPSVQNSLIIGYNLGGSSTTCSFAQKPSLIASNSNIVLSPGSNTSNAIKISVNELKGCSETFQVTASLPQGATGWSIALSTNTVTIDEPQSAGNAPQAGLTLYVSAQNGASPSSVQIIVNAVSMQNPALANTVALKYNISTQSLCTRYNPSLTISPPATWLPNGTSNTFYLTLTNNNNQFCDNGKGKFNISISNSSSLQIMSQNSTLSVDSGNYVTIPLNVTSLQSDTPGFYKLIVNATDVNNKSYFSTASAYFRVVPPCLSVTLSCLQQIGAVYPNWQHNLNVALASIVPKGYIYNLTVYLVYVPPNNPFAASLIPLNGNINITDGSAAAFRNAEDVASVRYTYTTPSLLMLELDLQLAEVTAP